MRHQRVDANCGCTDNLRFQDGSEDMLALLSFLVASIPFKKSMTYVNKLNHYLACKLLADTSAGMMAGK